MDSRQMMVHDQGFITIVSGLPRSGTSMMMQMLEAGGMSVITDGIRKPDDDNARGYYEFEPVKRVAEDGSWLDQASGKAVKMVYGLLYDLPSHYAYRVIFMQRNLEEVLASQQTMLKRQGINHSVPEDQMAKLFGNELERFQIWIQKLPAFAVHQVSYNGLIKNPQPHLEQINSFLGGRLNTIAMAKVIDASLYHNRC